MAAQRTLAGFHAVVARLKHAPASINAIYADPGRDDARMRKLREFARAAGVRIIAADGARLQAFAGETSHQGVVALCDDTQASRTLDDVLDDVDRTTLLLLLDGVTDPRNLGACLRTADAAGVAAVVIPRDRSAAMSPVVAKAAAGASESLALIVVTNLARAMQEIKDAGIWIYGADGAVESSIYDLDLTWPVAWVLGAEGEGLRRLTRDRCDGLASIPMAGAVESLNVSVATGVCLFEVGRQRRAATGAGARAESAAT